MGPGSDNVVKPNGGLCITEISKDMIAVFDRYQPRPLLLTKDFISFFKHLSNNYILHSQLIEKKELIVKLIENHILTLGDPGEGKKLFKEGLLYARKNMEDNMELMQHDKVRYGALYFNTEQCNLACSYCILNHNLQGGQGRPTALPKRAIDNAISVLHQFLSKKMTNQDITRSIHFNGGEILLKFNLIKAVIEYLNYFNEREKIHISINTNATLITDEIAMFLCKYFDEISISLDGGKENHDKSRIGHDGTPSFEKVIQGISRLNQYRCEGEKPTIAFQGTLTAQSSFEADSFSGLADYGIKRIRMGVDLLHATEFEAEDMACKHLDLMVKSQNSDVCVFDSPYGEFKKFIQGEKIGFGFPCNGLSPIGSSSLNYNIDSNQVSTICGFTKNISTKFGEIGENIYDPICVKNGLTYLIERSIAFESHCMECELVAACRGGCIMGGLNAFNELNSSACVFKKKLWNGMLDLIARDALPI